MKTIDERELPKKTTKKQKKKKQRQKGARATNFVVHLS